MSHEDYFAGGEWNLVCDVSGRKMKSSEAMRRWDNAVVHPDYWEPRHPQEFVRGARDDQSVPFSRPERDLSVAALGDIDPGVSAQADNSEFDQVLNADFVGAPLSGAAPLTVNFRDSSSGEVRARSWSFGNGTTSSQRDPQNIYTGVGVFTVALTVIGPEGSSDTETKTAYITVS